MGICRFAVHVTVTAYCYSVMLPWQEADCGCFWSHPAWDDLQNLTLS